MSHNPSSTFSQNGSEPGRLPEPKVVPGATRCTISAAYKLRIVEEKELVVRQDAGDVRLLPSIPMRDTWLGNSIRSPSMQNEFCS